METINGYTPHGNYVRFGIGQNPRFIIGIMTKNPIIIPIIAMNIMSVVPTATTIHLEGSMQFNPLYNPTFLYESI